MEQTVLVTGATGFLGSHLVKRLLQENYQVIIIKRSFSNTQRINEVLSQVIAYDLDKCELTQPFKENSQINTVIHTATCYGRNQESLENIVETNTVFPMKLLEIAIKFQTPTFLNTDTIFDKFFNPYCLSKKQFMEWGQYFANAKKSRFVNIKLEHMFGPDNDDTKFTTQVIKNCLNNVEELNLTAGEQKRDFIYIEDVISAYLVLLKEVSQGEFYQSYELGSSKAVSIRKFVEMVHQMTHSKTTLNFGTVPYRANEVMYSQSNIAALQALGWSPQYTLEKGLEKTINSYYGNSVK